MSKSTSTVKRKSTRLSREETPGDDVSHVPIEGSVGTGATNKRKRGKKTAPQGHLVMPADNVGHKVQRTTSNPSNSNSVASTSSSLETGNVNVDMETLVAIIQNTVKTTLENENMVVQSVSGESGNSGIVQGPTTPLIPMGVIPVVSPILPNTASPSVIDIVNQPLLPTASPTLPNTTHLSPETAPGSMGTLQDAVTSLLRSNSGDPNFNFPQEALFDLPLGAALSDKIRTKIISREYVELSALLWPSNDSYTIQVEPNNKATINLSNKDRKNVTNIENWTSAMFIYGGVYLGAYPTESPQFLKYLDLIRNMSTHTPIASWRLYDELVRRARHKSNVPWDRPLINQYMTAITNHNQVGSIASNPKPFSKKGSFRPNKSGNRMPQGFCYSFNQDVCTNKPPCKYSHICSKCYQNHSASNCTKSRAQSNQRANNSKFKSEHKK